MLYIYSVVLINITEQKSVEWTMKSKASFQNYCTEGVLARLGYLSHHGSGALFFFDTSEHKGAILDNADVASTVATVALPQ